MSEGQAATAELTDDQLFQQELAQEFADTPYFKSMEELAESEEPEDTGEEQPPSDTSEDQEPQEQIDDEGAESVPEDTGEEQPPADTTDWEAEFKQLKQKYDSFDGIVRKRTEELEELRAAVQELAPKAQDYDRFSQLLNENPAMFNDVLNQNRQTEQDFDFTDPKAIDKMVDNKVRAILQQREIETAQRTKQDSMRQLIATTKAGEDRMIAEGIVTESDMAAAKADLMSAIKGGNFGLIAYRNKNFDRLIAEARKQGADDAIKGLKTKTNIPPSLSKTTATPRNTANSNSFDNLTVDQLQNVYKGMKPGDNMKKFIDAFEKKMRKGG